MSPGVHAWRPSSLGKAPYCPAAGWALVSFEAAVYFIESCLLGPRDDEGDPPDARTPGADDSP